MKLKQILEIFKEHQAELTSRAVKSLAVFGSVARGDDGPESDIDIAVSLEERVVQSGFGYFSTLETVRERIEDLTGRNVDVLPEPVGKERLRQEVERDRIVAF